MCGIFAIWDQNNNVNKNINDSLDYYQEIKNTILNKLKDDPLVIESKIKKDFFINFFSYMRSKWI